MVELQEFDDFRYPRRWPWLLVIVAVMGGVWLWQRREKPEKPAAPDPEAPAVTIEEDAGSVPGVQPHRSSLADMDLNILLSEGKASEEAGEFLAARNRYLELLGRAPAGTWTRSSAPSARTSS